jgi:hypothetical protein
MCFPCNVLVADENYAPGGLAKPWRFLAEVLTDHTTGSYRRAGAGRTLVGMHTHRSQATTLAFRPV